eukprot:TRINITY_DN8695_c0_g1_i2.p1 TRINITY_DN8695_c0_g1~~TRINITY_DN8695_c0_g1_i2.p1  ORF type:complete len:110 (-),score=19.13 TRINITY_DN8695_c0_g1_i2:291-620(-)
MMRDAIWLFFFLFGFTRLYTQCDVYSVGVVIWEIMTSQVPFQEYPEFRQKKDLALLITGELQLRPTIPHSVPKDIAEIIRSAWHQNPDERMTASELYFALEGIAPHQII